MKVLDLFAGQNSFKKAIPNCDYIGIDITGDNLILDLSSDYILDKLKEIIPTGWIPDFIWASPPCNKFSLASAVKGGNLYFQRYKDSVKIREDITVLKSTVYKNKSLAAIKEEAALAIKMVNNTLKIIRHYGVPYIIENPNRSYIRYFIDLGYISKVDYCAYGYDYQKTTLLWSELPTLNLARCSHNNHSKKIGSRTSLKEYADNQKSITGYYNKSSVPPELIREVFNKIIERSI